VLRTFASAGGDVVRTAKLAGLSVDDVRSELLTLIEGSANGSSNNGTPVFVESEARIARKTDAAAGARSAVKGKPPKKK
jgi:hypothetical protein